MSAVPVPSARRARVRLGIGAALVLLLVALGAAVLVAALSSPGEAVSISSGEAGDETGSSGEKPGGDDSASGTPGSVGGGAQVFVHILGQVERPGLYQLTEGARAVDAVAAAGGFTAAADPATVNLARFLSDGEQIVVPAVGEAPAAGAPGAPGGGGTPSGAVIPGKVNINTADAATLETLPRIGPAMSQRILDWRETNGPFTAVEDLMSVTGVGEKTFEGLRDLVTV